MKKCFCIVILACMLFSIIHASFAASSDNSHDIMGKFVYSTDENVVQAVSYTSEYTAKIGNITVKVKLNAPKTGMSLIVRLVDKDDKSAFDWFTECTEKLGEGKLFLYIYFIDRNGNKVESDYSAKVTVSADSINDASVTHTLSTGGELLQLNSEASNGSIEFTIDESGYIIISQNNLPTVILGDVNEDEKVNTADAVVVLKHSASMITLTENQLLAGDTNKDGKVNTADAVLILKYAAEMISEF